MAERDHGFVPSLSFPTKSLHQETACDGRRKRWPWISTTPSYSRSGTDPKNETCTTLFIAAPKPSRSRANTRSSGCRLRQRTGTPAKCVFKRPVHGSDRFRQAISQHGFDDRCSNVAHKLSRQSYLLFMAPCRFDALLGVVPRRPVTSELAHAAPFQRERHGPLGQSSNAANCVSDHGNVVTPAAMAGVRLIRLPSSFVIVSDECTRQKL